VGSAGIGDYLPLLVLVGSAGAVGAVLAVSLAALATAGALTGTRTTLTAYRLSHKPGGNDLGRGS
jgi:hypothetical protein